MILLNIQLPCTACATQAVQDSQPNYCRRCGGRGFLRSTITRHQLSRLRDIPIVLGATISVSPRRTAHKPQRKAAAR